MRSRPIDRSYKSAINILHSRRRPDRPSIKPGSNPPGLSRIPDAQGNPDLKGTPSIVGMKQWLHQIGHSTAEVDNLNIVHVAGTKGKGSTCAFIESFLRAFGERTGFPRKTGLYTSPHLIYPEERIRINFQPIARDLFAKYFFEVWDVFSEEDSSLRTLPRYLQLIALVSFHAFIKEGVEAAIFETHHGGEYDATNVIEHPVATVITTLGMDHVKQLGPTIENIAWHKAGIFKHGAHALSSPQEASAAAVLRSRASEKDINVQFVENDPSLPTDALQLKPDIQRMNCSVALAAVRCFLEQRASKDAGPLSSSDILQGIGQFSWPGRFQLLVEGAFNWFLDGAHNEMSVSKAAEWFIESSQGERASLVRILIFSQVSEQRDAKIVLERLATALSTIRIHHVIFTLYDPEQDFDSTTAVVAKSEDTLQKAFGEIWKRFHQDSRILYEPNIQKALDSAREIGTEAKGMQTLITGSQHLVGGALYSLNSYAPGQGSA
ncbi:FolC Folylpolyglutamate synthase [Pyrenophora tritici-repentis]|nr:Folylpolyglutamate synthase like protein [Pyrenophora tritici-repentis]KAI1526949.1 FolC Folylpolyglutamate synthase [Pyrenophora tritici-repentis]KAI1572685.1 FolC Folylpolyglutamate synthase [Pyrenophora tritici-repentis]KAI1596273.1 FolC Folylpolyglutamate synthase [Pyrenophora tritici-repentis]KAI1665225.1 Folylpolyglutamate synthase protein [Pyrenophora tritici-repentis]